MAAGAVELQRMQWRLEELEQRVGVGACGPCKVADEVGKVQMALSNITGKRERIKILFKKNKQVINSRAALLEQVKNLQPILDSASIQAVPDHATKLQRLSQIHIQQQEQCHDLTDDVKILLEDYNKMTLLLSKQFVQWNEILTRLETAKEEKPAAE
ncbi:dynactin subunit 3 isoform X2 [Falco biarmicus]|uniref:dynactin subunit 3 isoform X2 n=1 Tax=Falco rusticolus TaxID=120794 RepID=UPI001886710C|nr:dynactin subunit 3 isoform X2 [Falco rusticolus]XP_055555541.1 dynactin subunit 3 isoform X2 [Falco cherrug]XP_056179892.1 dynactin subunit 3 isoform X2 [Falco biarmicus]